MLETALQTRRSTFRTTGFAAFFFASRTRSAMVVLPKKTMMRDCTGFHRSHKEQAFAEVHSGSPPAQAVKLLIPSTASTMSISFNFLAGVFRQKPPVGPLLDFSRPFAGDPLQDLGQKVRRNLFFLRDVLYHRELFLR